MTYTPKPPPERLLPFLKDGEWDEVVDAASRAKIQRRLHGRSLDRVAYLREYRRKNAARLRAYDKARYKGERKESCKSRARAQYADDPVAHKARNKDWIDRNRERHNAKGRVKCQRRRAKVQGAFVEDVELDVLYERDEGFCSICGEKVPRRTNVKRLAPTIDHITPLSRGGEHSYENTALAHHGCNSSKRNRLPEKLAAIG